MLSLTTMSLTHSVMQRPGIEKGTGLGNETGIVTEVPDGEEIAPAAENGTAIGGAVTDMISMKAGVDGVKTQIESGDPRGMSTSSMTGQLCVVSSCSANDFQDTSTCISADACAVTCREYRRKG